jgi:hypothetical protein
LHGAHVWSITSQPDDRCPSFPKPFVNYLAWAERDAPGITTFNSRFRTNGYRNGDTIRTNAFRFTEYSNDKGQQTSRMLYDHKHDPSENTNVAEVHMDSTSDLAEQLHRLMGRNKSPAK